MSLIPYPSDSREIVLRRGNAIVVLDPHSHQFSVSEATDQALEHTECPYCHRPWRDDATAGDDHPNGSRSFGFNRPFVDPDYFGMLAASQRATPVGSRPSTPHRRLFQPAALRSGRSRDVSGTADPPPGAEFVDSAPAAASGEGISSSAFSPGFFKQFFVEQGVLGRGGNGVVLLVEHLMDRVSLGHFACKRVPVGNNHGWLEKVLVEVKLLQKVPHKNLVAYHWVWLEDYQQSTFGPSIPCLWILQEYCNGGDLHNYVLGPKEELDTAEKLKQRMRRRSKGDPEPPRDLRGHSKLTLDEIFSFFRDITSGLHHLHTKGYIHRDLKPSNCLLQRDGTKTRVLISDFGEVQAAGAQRGSTGATGTISYCAPEVLRRDLPGGTFGEFTPKSDIFSLGMIVYFMCFGRLPYSNADGINEENEDIDELRAEIMTWAGFDDGARARVDLPDRLYRFLRRLLSVDPNERPSTGEILSSIKAGVALGDADEARMSPLDSSTHRPFHRGRTASSFSRSGLSSLSRRRSGDSGRSRSPLKNETRRTSQSHSRPPTPLDSSMIIQRPRKIDLPVGDDAPPPQQSPRLMLPPPPPPLERAVANRLLRFAHQPAAGHAFRAFLFAIKTLSLSLPCSPYAANAWLLYPLLGLAVLDLGLLSPQLRRSLLLLGVHATAVLLASQRGRLCEGKVMVWEDV